MTCKDCANYTECANISQTNSDHAHKMWMIDFWENAEQRCVMFSEKTAHWYINPDGYYPQCSNCWEEPTDGKLSERCPNCGFKMERETT